MSKRVVSLRHSATVALLSLLLGAGLLVADPDDQGNTTPEPLPTEASPATDETTTPEAADESTFVPPTIDIEDPDRVVGGQITTTGGDDSGSSGSTVGPSLSLAFVYGVLLIAAAVFAWTYMKKGRIALPRAPSGKIELVETKALGNKQFLVLVEVEGQRSLIGVGPGFIQHVSDLEPTTSFETETFADDHLEAPVVGKEV